MIKYDTRACNFYYGKEAQLQIKKKIALPLCGNRFIAFDSIELFIRSNKKINSKIVLLKNLNKLNRLEYKIITKALRKITKKRKNFLKNVDFSKPIVMGILNLTPDSFSDGGLFNKNTKSLEHISNMINSGAEIIDVGGESTRPGSKTVSINNEWKRLKYVLKNFKNRFSKTCLSVDTRKSHIMIKAINCGANLINDVSGFNYDKKSIKVLKKKKTPKVIHHMQGTPKTMQNNPKYNNVLLDIYDFFEDKINDLSDKNIIIDPGIGFGKTLKHNLTLISKISLFHSLGFPIMIGTSRKRFINEISKKYDSKERIGGTIASVLFLLSQGVQIYRVHNVREVKQGISVFREILLNQ